jgi:redox-sensing transcriptional repressor
MISMSQARNSNDKETVSELTTGRLSVYLRCLTYLESINRKTVSSHEMAAQFHSAQMRKDLACFGEFGTRGVGYNVSKLKEHLVRTLGIDRVRNVLIAGAGNLGMALADYGGFNENGFRIIGLLDTAAEKVGLTSRTGIPVLPYDQLSAIAGEHNIEIGIIAVPASSAQEVYDALATAKVSAILNFAPVQIRTQSGVKLKSVDLRINLESLSFYLKSVEDGV